MHFQTFCWLMASLTRCREYSCRFHCCCCCSCSCSCFPLPASPSFLPSSSSSCCLHHASTPAFLFGCVQVCLGPANELVSKTQEVSFALAHVGAVSLAKAPKVSFILFYFFVSILWFSSWMHVHVCMCVLLQQNSVDNSVAV